MERGPQHADGTNRRRRNPASEWKSARGWRDEHFAFVRLNSGVVLIVGGTTDGGVTGTAELY